MAARLVLALVSVLVIAWVGVLLRDYEVGRDAVVRRDPDGIRSARFLDPSAYWDYVLGSVYLLKGDDRSAAIEAERLVSSEPDNILGWAVLRAATRESDPRRSRQATAALRRLNPLTAP